VACGSAGWGDDREDGVLCKMSGSCSPFSCSCFLGPFFGFCMNEVYPACLLFWDVACSFMEITLLRNVI
jgi:hypothetical protein